MLCSEATASLGCLECSKIRYQRNACNVDMKLLFAILTKNTLFRSYSTFAYLLCVCIRNNDKYAYVHITSARGHELIGHVRADAYNLIFAPYYYAR